MDINKEIGKKIKIYRKLRNLTLKDLSNIIYKSTSTISKYENGTISIDIETLYSIASAFKINVDQLLYIRDEDLVTENIEIVPAFFENLSQFFGYYYDGRSNEIITCVFDIISSIGINSYNIRMYMNCKNLKKYQICENTYKGKLDHFHAKSNIIITNQDTPMEVASLQILASYLDSHEKWGLFTGFSSRPMMPIATKMLLTKEPLNINKELEQKLKISKEDIRLLRMYNMFTVL